MIGESWITTQFDRLEEWAQRNSFWPLPFGTAGYDQMSTLLLAVEKAGTTDVAKVREAMFAICNPPGETVIDPIEGLKAIRAGTEINYSGASSSVDFDQEGMIKSRDFVLWEIKDGKDLVIERIES